MVQILPDNMDNPFENDPFPSGYVPNINEDKLFKHVVFHTGEENLKLRVTAVGHDWTASTESEQKDVDLLLDSWNPEKDKIRIKAVLDSEVDGVAESHWVQQRFVSKDEAQKVNQFRVRGVSDQGWKSKWVYSELRDEDNDLIAFELLYDLMDVLLYTHEHDLEALLDMAVKDTFMNLLYNQASKEIGYSYMYDFDIEKQVQMKENTSMVGKGQEVFDLLVQAGIEESAVSQLKKTYLQPNESKKAKIEELSKIVSHLLRKEFREMIHSSSNEVTELAKMYRFIDRYQTHQEDFAYLVLEGFLEDRYEKVLEEADFRVMLSNDEEMHLLLQSVYDFDIKSELLRHAYDLGLDDHFVTVMNDAVQLISEPIVFERLQVRAGEETAKFLRMAFQEVFVPFLIMEKRLAELETELTDEMSYNPKDKVIEYSTIHTAENPEDEDYIIRHLFLEEMIEMLMTDLNIEDNYHMDLLDRIINMVDKERISLFIDYDPVEFVEIFSKISEDFKYEYQTLVGSRNEKVSTKLEDSLSTKDLKDSMITKDITTVQRLEKVQAKDLTEKGNVTELSSIQLKDSLLADDMTKSAPINEKFAPKTLDSIQLDDLTDRSHQHQHVATHTAEEVKNESLMKVGSLREALQAKTLELQIVMALLDNSVVQDMTKIGASDQATARNKTSQLHQEISQRIALQVEILNKDMTLYQANKESKKAGQLDAYENLYNLQPLDHLLKVYKEFKEQHLDVERLDNFFEIMWNLKDNVQVFLGDLGGAWPLGQFILGTSTLKGDPNNPNSNKLQDYQDPNQYI